MSMVYFFLNYFWVGLYAGVHTSSGQKLGAFTLSFMGNVGLSMGLLFLKVGLIGGVLQVCNKIQLQFIVKLSVLIDYTLMKVKYNFLHLTISTLPHRLFLKIFVNNVSTKVILNKVENVARRQTYLQLPFICYFDI